MGSILDKGTSQCKGPGAEKHPRPVGLQAGRGAGEAAPEAFHQYQRLLPWSRCLLIRATARNGQPFHSGPRATAAGPSTPHLLPVPTPGTPCNLSLQR